MAGWGLVGSAAREGRAMEGKGFVVGLAVAVLLLAVLFGVALAAGSNDDTGGEDCISQEYC